MITLHSECEAVHKLSAEQDERLRKVEQTAGLRAKVKLRATVLRLSNQGWDTERLVHYSGRSRWSILRDFERWEAQGIAGLADGTAPGNPLQVTAEVRAFLQEEPEEERAWHAAQGERLLVRTRWGRKGRLNLMGSCSLQGEKEQLEYRFLSI